VNVVKRIGLLVTCLGDTLFPEAPKATVVVLERLGHEVVFPREQTCCGQLHLNSGYRGEALALAGRLARIFDGVDAVVSPSSSCVGAVRELSPELAPRVFELSEFLVSQLGIEDVGASFPHRVTYHPTCHSLRVARVGDAPVRLLRAVRGLELVELPDAAECCGFGGTFSVKNAETSTAMLADKCRAVLSTGAEVCTAVDASCLMQIGGGLSRRRAGVRTMHLAEILAS
jgi:L-lactate dehydrogenase complex protein LldE